MVSVVYDWLIDIIFISYLKTFQDEDNSWFPWDLNENSDEQNIGEPVNVELELEHFRIQWQKELHNRPDASHVISNLEENDANDNQLVEPTVEEQVSVCFYASHQFVCSERKTSQTPHVIPRRPYWKLIEFFIMASHIVLTHIQFLLTKWYAGDRCAEFIHLWYIMPFILQLNTLIMVHLRNWYTQFVNLLLYPF